MTNYYVTAYKVIELKPHQWSTNASRRQHERGRKRYDERTKLGRLFVRFDVRMKKLAKRAHNRTVRARRLDA